MRQKDNKNYEKQNTKVRWGDRPSTYTHNCRRTICGADGSCGKGMHADRREMDEATTTKWGNNKET